jgi:hypothetical protein
MPPISTTTHEPRQPGAWRAFGVVSSFTLCRPGLFAGMFLFLTAAVREVTMKFNWGFFSL